MKHKITRSALKLFVAFAPKEAPTLIEILKANGFKVFGNLDRQQLDVSNRPFYGSEANDLIAAIYFDDMTATWHGHRPFKFGSSHEYANAISVFEFHGLMQHGGLPASVQVECTNLKEFISLIAALKGLGSEQA